MKTNNKTEEEKEIEEVEEGFLARLISDYSLIISLLVSLIICITILVAIFSEVIKVIEINNYIETTIVDKKLNSNNYISSRSVILEDLFGTKSNFLKEVKESGRIELRLNEVKKRDERRDQFLNS